MALAVGVFCPAGASVPGQAGTCWSAIVNKVVPSKQLSWQLLLWKRINAGGNGENYSVPDGQEWLELMSNSGRVDFHLSSSFFGLKRGTG